MAGVLTGPATTGPTCAPGQPGNPARLVVVAHRGPVRFDHAPDGYVEHRAGGGLVTALRDLVRQTGESRWICAASTPADREIAARTPWAPVQFGDATCLVRMLDLPEVAHRAFYAQIANPLLWFVQHYLWNQACAPDIGDDEHRAWNEGYVAVNHAFADAVSDPDDVPACSVVMVHDYHFYLVPGLVRERRDDVFLHFFVHIPWPQPDAWRVLPRAWREQVFGGLLGSDIVAFQTEHFADNFLLGCEELGYAVDWEAKLVCVGGRQVTVRHYPISIDVGELHALGDTEEAAHYRAELDAAATEQLILRVDRTDPSKNIVRGFRAFDRLLERHPELVGRVTFLALLQPSRQDVKEYVEYLRDIRDVVGRVNARWGTADWTPIDLRLGDNMPLTVAAYGRFDVLMVNSVFDGMNLVAKEALVVNERDGVLALSENTGAYDELGAIAVTLHPFDIEQQADALHAALAMPAAKRRERHIAGVEIVETNNVQKWLHRQLDDVAALRAAGAPVTSGRIEEIVLLDE